MDAAWGPIYGHVLERTSVKRSRSQPSSSQQASGVSSSNLREKAAQTRDWADELSTRAHLHSVKLPRKPLIADQLQHHRDHAIDQHQTIPAPQIKEALPRMSGPHRKQPRISGLRMMSVSRLTRLGLVRLASVSLATRQVSWPPNSSLPARIGSSFYVDQGVAAFCTNTPS